MESPLKQIESIVDEFKIQTVNDVQISKAAQEELKKSKKKQRKQIVELTQTDVSAALEKTARLIEILNKNYQTASKAETQYNNEKQIIEKLKADHQKAIEQKKTFEMLHSNFLKRYDDQLKLAQDYEVQEQQKRTKTIQELQERIKNIQSKYQQSGKAKIERIQENQRLKHDVQRLEPSVAASETLIDAQLKKKAIQIEIQMTTLKQKIEMIENYKNMGNDSRIKLQKAKSDNQKIEARLKIFNVKEQQHKIAITKAHLVIDDYKKSIMSIRDILEKSERQTRTYKQKVSKSEQALNKVKQESAAFKKQLETQNEQLQGLLNLENTLKEQLKNL